MAGSWRKSRRSSDSEVEKDPSDSSEPSDKGIKKNLFPDDSSDSGDSKVEIDTSDASEKEDLCKGFENLTVSSCKETTDGQWLSRHPWESKKPWDFNVKMQDTVANSGSYPTSSEWTRKVGEKEMVDLAKIYLNLPTFVRREMQGSINGSRQELKQIIRKLDCEENPISQNLSDLAPHTREIVEEIRDDIGREDKRSEPIDTQCHLKATSIQFSPMCPTEENYFHYDCEYMIEIFVPSHLLSWFDTQRCEEARWIKKIKFRYKEKRWIFIPSFRREQIALLKWPEDETVNQESTIRILVVRPSEFAAYVMYCGHKFPVICLPQDEIGAGYPRYWIQKIALRLGLQFIWMIDDSFECCYEYHPHQNPPKVGSYSTYRRRKFGLVFERIEDFVKEADDNKKLIAAMSPRRVDWRRKLQQPFVCKPPQCAVYLNLSLLSKNNVYYRPELKTLEDMIFGYECEQKGLKVYMDNRIHLQDHNWKDTGASSPSVTSK